MKVNPLDTLKIVSSSNLNLDDYQALTLLYQPLIGSRAFTLLLTMYSLLDRSNLKTDNMSHKNLLDLLGITPEVFLCERQKLEAMGLLNSYFKEDSFLYFLKQPLTPKQFLSDGCLGTYLCSEIGDALYKQLEKRFILEKVSRNEYDNITKSFDEVFKTDFDNERIAASGFLLNRKLNQNIVIKDKSFDYEYFVALLRDYLPSQKVNNPKFKESIRRLSYVYGIDADQMQHLCLEAYDGSDIDFAILKDKALGFYRYKKDNRTPVIMVKKEKINTSSNDKVSFLDNTNPREILETRSNMSAASSELKTIHDLWEKTGFEIGVINALLIYILEKKDGEFPSYAYFEKVAAEWARKGITTTEKAVEYIQTKNEKPEKLVKKTEAPVKKSNKEWINDWYAKIEAGDQDE